MEITKNRQSEENIRRMAMKAFPVKEIDFINELTDGMCNAAYMIRFEDGSKSVLKIASGNKEGLMSNEINMMDAEVKAMQIMEKNDFVKVAKVQYYDTSKTLCNGNYFFMEALEGESYFSAKNKYSEKEQNVVNYEIGQAERYITSIKGEYFGLLGSGDKYDNLFAFVYSLISNILSDAKKKNIVIGVDADDILNVLVKDKAVFDEIKQPTLVHWDMWEGNIFVKDKHICGIIDWERAMWGEAFMDDRFRRHTRNREFLKGYGKVDFTDGEMCRIYWYDVLLYLTMMTEGAYRGYADDSQYQWTKPLFETSWKEILKRDGK